MTLNIQLISAPSILGLKPGGVELLGESLLATGLAEFLHSVNPVIKVLTKNASYSPERDKKTNCLNPVQIHEFSLLLSEQITQQLNKNTFPVVMGGDCSILLGIMPAMKKAGKFGLIFVDAHADFYDPVSSPTGEVADMDLAIVTGHGPGILANISDLKPYVKEGHVIHIGQRDAAETKKYDSPDIRKTKINCFDLERIRSEGLPAVIDEIMKLITTMDLAGFWLHFDTDVVSDDENPAVDYRLPGGLTFKETEHLLQKLIETGKIAGMGVTIFNPKLDTGGKIAGKITNCISNCLDQDLGEFSD